MHSINLCDLIKIWKNDSLSHSWVLTRARCSLSPILTDLSRIIHQIKFFFMFFFSAEVDLKSTRGKKFCSVVWNRVHINIFVLRGCRSTITDCFFCSAEPSVMNKKYKRINCIFIHHPPHPVRFPKSAASYTLESCRGVFQHSRQKQEDASTVKEDNLMSAAAVGFLP